MQHAQKQSSGYVAVLQCNANFWSPAICNSTEKNRDEFMNVILHRPLHKPSPGKLSHPDTTPNK